MSQTQTANLVDVFALNGLPSEYLSGKQIQERYRIGPATFWRWKKEDNTLGFPAARFGEGVSARWALEDVIAWEQSNTRKQSREAS